MNPGRYLSEPIASPDLPLCGAGRSDHCVFLLIVAGGIVSAYRFGRRLPGLANLPGSLDAAGRPERRISTTPTALAQPSGAAVYTGGRHPGAGRTPIKSG